MRFITDGQLLLPHDLLRHTVILLYKYSY